MSDDREYLTIKEALAMLADGEDIHTFRNPGPAMLLGADWPRQQLIEVISKAKPEKAGAMATKMKHGLVIHDDHGPLFIATKEQS